MAKSPPEDYAVVSATATATVLASATGDGNAPPWRPDNEYASEALSTSSDPAAPYRSGPVNDGKWLTHLQSIIHIDLGREGFGWSMTAVWRSIVNEPGALPPELWQVLLQSTLNALGEKRPPACGGKSRRRLVAAGVMRWWRPGLN